MDTKKKINILVANNTNPVDYIKYLNMAFDTTLITHEQFFTKANDIHIDLVLFTGGEDVNPAYYTEPVGKFTGVNKERDKKEQVVYNSLPHTPKLGICRGSQFLTVMNGGELIQHVNNHGSSHELSIENWGDYGITSTHHQMMYPYNLPANKYKIVGWSKYFKATTYLDGWNNEKNLPKDFLEPEIVFYPNTKTLCIQGHPEMESCPKNTKEVCIQLIKAYLQL